MATRDIKISRAAAAELGRQTVSIVDQGWYETPACRRVEISALVRAARNGTVAYPPDAQLADVAAGRFETQIDVRNETTLDAARLLLENHDDVVILNFASAKHPGGGFLNGARAQEEYLARSSALYACIRDQPMYRYHAERPDPFYSDYCIYAPRVPIIRDDAGELLEEPYAVSVITAAAVNARHVPTNRRSEISPTMRRRIERVLTIGRIHGYEAIVLGAWGCGAFGNDTPMIAQLFFDALQGTFRGAYRHVKFAITDWSEERRFIGPFEDRFSTKTWKC